jgi:hypothetical protein
VLSLLGLADPPLFSLLVHENKKIAISLIIRKDILNYSVAEPYQHYFKKSDPDWHQSDKPDPDPHQSQKPDSNLDPHQSEKPCSGSDPKHC